MRHSTLGILILAICATAGVAMVQDRDDNQEHHVVLALEPTMVLRGEGMLAGGTATIVLPDRFERWCKEENRCVQLTCKGGWSPLFASDVAGGQFTVSTTANGSKEQAFWWEVQFCRKPGVLGAPLKP